MQRYVLRFTGQGAAPAADLERISSTAGVSVIDTTARMVLVEASAADGSQLASTLAGWVCVPEQTVPLPDPRPRPSAAPGGPPPPGSPGIRSASSRVRGDRRGSRSKPPGGSRGSRGRS